MSRFAYRLTGVVDAAEDITQECFLRLVRSPGFDPERGSLRQYLYGIVRNLFRQRQQARRREVHWDDNDVENELKSAAAVCLDPMASVELSAVVQAAVLELPPLQRVAIVLFEFEELSLEETAAVVELKFGLSNRDSIGRGKASVAVSRRTGTTSGRRYQREIPCEFTE